jgi:cation transport regulator ChaC
MKVQPGHLHAISTKPVHHAQTKAHLEVVNQTHEPMFYYFAYGSCMCPVDLKRSLGEKTHQYVVGPATLPGYRLVFYGYSDLRNCGVLDVIKDPNASVEGVLYELPMRLSDALDRREVGYRSEMVKTVTNDKLYPNVRTYSVIDKLSEELAPNDWYINTVLRGAVTCGLTEQYCWHLFNHMHQLQRNCQHQIRRTA